MNEDEKIRKIVREEIVRALRDFFAEKRLSDMEETYSEAYSVPPSLRRLDYQVDRLSYQADRLAFLSTWMESWGNECECRYSEDDIRDIKNKLGCP